jgi:hypothetical protein
VIAVDLAELHLFLMAARVFEVTLSAQVLGELPMDPLAPELGRRPLDCIVDHAEHGSPLVFIIFR